MNIIILYFSGTGNTELITRELCQRFKKNGDMVESVSIEDEEQIRRLDFKDKVIGFGFPVYKFSFPDIFNKYFEIINKKSYNNPYFLFSTYARFTADSFYEFTKNLDKKKFHYIAEESFKSPSCGLAARKDESEFEYQSVMFFKDNIQNKIDSFAIKIINDCSSSNRKTTHYYNPLNALRLKLVKDIEHSKYPKLQIDNRTCSLCGLCVKKCPEKNLIVQDHYIEIIDSSYCLHCLRCMNHCPTNSISFGRLSVGDNRYTLKKRDELFHKANSGYKEKNWENFEEICAAWRRKTLKYWWRHKKNPEF